MNIVYIDRVRLTHAFIKETFKEDKVSVFAELSDFVTTFDVDTIKERRVIILDIPFDINKSIEYVKKLKYLRTLSEGCLKIVIFSDFRKIHYGLNKILISPNLTIDKKSKLDDISYGIKNIFSAKRDNLLSDNRIEDMTPTLTYREYLYVVDLMRGKSIKEISNISRKGVKIIYTHRKNIFIKYKLKNMAALHSALVYE